MAEVVDLRAVSAPAAHARRSPRRGLARPAAAPTATALRGGRRSICYYTPSADPSGMGTHLLDLVAATVRHADVSVMCRPTVGGRRVLEGAAALGAATVPLPGPRECSFRDVVRRFLLGTAPDVFHCHVGIGWEGWGGVEAARLAGVPVVVQTQHLPFLLSHPGKRRALLRTVGGVDRVIAVSDGVRRTYEAIGVPFDRLVTVPNGVPERGAGPGRRAVRAALGLRADQPVVMTVGRLTNMKGQRYLVDATPHLVSRVAGVVVVVVGDGPLRTQLESRAAAIGVHGSVRLLGHRSDARFLLDAADVFVLPSRHEGMPLAAIEAMEAGLPVVATHVIGSREVVADGETGVLVPPEDSVALGAAIAELLTDAGLRATYGAAGRRRYLDRFTAELMAARTQVVYERLLAGAGAVPALTQDQA